jgi:hypothetical protein
MGTLLPICHREKNNRYRLLYKREDGRVRLLRASDYVHPDRHLKFYPELQDIPERYHALVEWGKKYSEQAVDSGSSGGESWLAGLHQLRGLGREAWRGVNADDYVRNLREGWE